MEKLISISKKLDTFFKVLQKIIFGGIAAAVLVTIILTIVNLINPGAVIGEDFHIVDIRPITIELAQELAPNNNTILMYVWAVVVLGIVSAALIYRGLGLLRKILKPMTEGKPFDSGIGQNIKKIGYIALILGVAQNVGSIIETTAAIHAFRLTALADSGAVRSITANYTFDVSFLIVFFVLILMSYIFDYGTELQQLSDETL